MTKDEALDLALDALESERDKYLEWGDEDGAPDDVYEAITAIKQARALDKKADNARELGLDYEPVLKDNSNYRYDPPVAAPVQSCYCPNCEAMGKELAALKAQQPVQEPVAWMYEDMMGLVGVRVQKEKPIVARPVTPLCLCTPPAAQPAPVPLTNTEFGEQWFKQTGRIMGTDKQLLLQAKRVTEAAHNIGVKK